MLYSSKPVKLGVLLCSSLCLNEVSLPFFPIHGIKIILVILLLVSEYKNVPAVLGFLKTHTLGHAVIMMFAFNIAWGLSSPHVLSGMSNFIAFFISEFLLRYFVFIYAYTLISSYKDFHIINRWLVYSMIVLTLFGVHNFLNRYSIFMDSISVGNMDYDSVGLRYNANDERYRVQSMFALACNYGYVCNIVLLWALFTYTNKLIRKNHFLLLTLCAALGVIMCGFRACMLSTIISVCVWALCVFPKRKFAKIIVMAIILIIILYSNIPFVAEKVGTFLTMFDVNNQDGSSISMRIMQLTAVLSHLDGYYLFGRGWGFFLYDMGYIDGASGLLDEELLGMESIIFHLLLESGLLGIMFNILFWYLFYMYAHKREFVSTSSLGFFYSILTAYVLFSVTTGEQGAVFITMIMLGISAKVIDFSK